MTEKKRLNRGTVCVFLCGLLFSVGGLCLKTVPWGSLAINSFRCLLSGLTIYAFMRLTHRKVRVNKHILITSAAMIATTTIYALAVKLTTAGAAIVMQFTVPIWTMIFGVLLFHKKPRRGDIIACLVVFAGIGICFYEGLAGGRTLGNVLGLLSGVTYSGVFMGNSHEDSDPMSSAVIGQLASGILELPWLLKADFSALDTKSWAALIVLGMFQMGLAYIFLSIGLLTTPPVTASLLTGIEPVMNPVWVALFYGEMITPLFALGGIIVLVSVTLYGIWNSKQEAEGAPG
jgi:drug/metabolite transporter (DMT)-like permease